MRINDISSRVIKAAINVHKELGPGLLESVYQSCMEIELKNIGLEFQKEVALPITYKGKKIHKEGFRIDLLVEDTLVVELKSIEKIKAIHKKQLLTYLKLACKPIGLLINFNSTMLKDGITRILNDQNDAQ